MFFLRKELLLRQLILSPPTPKIRTILSCEEQCDGRFISFLVNLLPDPKPKRYGTVFYFLPETSSPLRMSCAISCERRGLVNRVQSPPKIPKIAKIFVSQD